MKTPVENMNKTIIRLINDSPYKAFFAITGGGQSFIGDYCKVSGASKTIVGAYVPYSQASFDDFIGPNRLKKYASEEGARKLAVKAFAECVRFGVPVEYAIGIGASSSLAKDNERQGRKNHTHVAIHTKTTTKVANVTFAEGMSRPKQEKEVVNWIFEGLLAEATASSDEIKPPSWYSYRTYFCDGATDILYNDVPYFSHFDSSPETLGIFAGSFNPPHAGHFEIARIAESILGTKIIFELSISNISKGTIDYADLSIRTNKLEDLGYPYILTNAPTYLEKLRMFRSQFPNKKIVFIMGADTWKRLWTEKISGCPLELEARLENLGAKFLVFSRGNESIYTGYGESMRIRNPLAENFNNNISSSEIRKSL